MIAVFVQETVLVLDTTLATVHLDIMEQTARITIAMVFHAQTQMFVVHMEIVHHRTTVHVISDTLETIVPYTIVME